jgi:hypothetical protein
MNAYIPQHLFSRNLEESQVDAAGLRKLYRSDPVARQVFDIFASRSNDSYITTVGSLVSRINGGGSLVMRKEIVELFQKLQKLKCGEYKKGWQTGDAKSQSRFVWSVSVVSVGQAATNKLKR